MKRVSPYLILAFIFGCSSSTPYQAMKKKDKGGYIDEVSDGIKKVIFKGNSLTKKRDADLFAKFRAVENCQGEAKKMVHVLGVSDLSEKKEVIRSSGGGPYYSFGMSPYYNRYSSLGVGFGFGPPMQMWNETQVYPDVQVYYECTDVAFEPEVLFREVPAEEMKLLVKDLKGGLQVEKIFEGSPNIKTLEYGDVLLKANGIRIEKVHDLLKLAADGKTLKVQVMREGERKILDLKSKDVTASVQSSQEEIIKAGCEVKEIKKRPICGTK